MTQATSPMGGTIPRAPAAGEAAAPFLPQAAPFVLLDRIVTLEGARGIFTRHVPADDPLIAPGGTLSPLLGVEAIAQGAGIVLVHLDPALRTRGAVLAAIDHCDVHARVRAGETMTIEVGVTRRYGDMARVHGETRVGARVCTVASLTLAFAADPPGTGSS